MTAFPERSTNSANVSGCAAPTYEKSYRCRFAKNSCDLVAVFRLRFLVFNLELKEGLASSYTTGWDTDEFDEACDHLIVEHVPTGDVVGTYRLQTGRSAQVHKGYYSAREFDFSVYEPLRLSLVELGRAAIHPAHRSFEVLSLLWRGIARYATERDARHLVGCCSLSSQCTLEGSNLYHQLRPFLVEASLRTSPNAPFRFPISATPIAGPATKPPKLLRLYLSLGAKICGPPALDREFKTIDFLTLLDLRNMDATAKRRFLDI